MELHINSLLESIKRHKIANHMLTTTYPLIKDPKLLVAVVDNLNQSLTAAMNSILYYERMYKRIPIYSDTFESKFQLIKKHSKRLNIDPISLNTLFEIQTILEEHKKSPVEFSKNNAFIICNENYKMKTLDVPQIKTYLNNAKLLINSAKIIIKND